MRKFVRAVVVIPVAVLILAVALANRQWVTFTLDPFAVSDGALAFSLPLFAFAFVLAIAGVIVGGAAAWVRQSKWRKAARVAEGEAHALRVENDRLKRQLDAAHAAAAQANAPPIALRPPAA